MDPFREFGHAIERPSWEYKLVSFFVGDLQGASDRLNALGNQGWELVATVPGDSLSIVYALKRLRA